MDAVQFVRDSVSKSQEFGRLLAEDPSALPSLMRAFGSRLFEIHRVCDRIDYLYDANYVHKDAEMFSRGVYIGMADGVVYIKDKKKQCGIACLRKLDADDVFSIRLFVENKASHRFFDRTWEKEPSLPNVMGHELSGDYKQATKLDYRFWNFTNTDDNVEIFSESEGFLNASVTHEICFLLRWTTNMIGFVN